MRILKKDIRAFLAPLYQELLHSEKQNVRASLGGITAYVGKAWQRRGYVAWKASYGFVLPDGRDTGYQWDTLASAIDGLSYWLEKGGK